MAMGNRDPREVATALADLAQLGFLRPAAQSSMAGEREYAFWHVLGRDVAYRQLPRGSRAARHAAAATWLEAKLGERVDDIADVLADHWGTALELSRAAGQEDRASQAEPKAIAFLVRAGERAMGLDIGAALARFEAAKDLAAPGHPQRPEILVRFGETAPHLGRADEALAALDEAIEAFETRRRLAGEGASAGGQGTAPWWEAPGDVRFAASASKERSRSWRPTSQRPSWPMPSPSWASTSSTGQRGSRPSRPSIGPWPSRRSSDCRRRAGRWDSAAGRG